MSEFVALNILSRKGIITPNTVPFQWVGWNDWADFRKGIILYFPSEHLQS